MKFLPCVARPPHILLQLQIMHACYYIVGNPIEAEKQLEKTFMGGTQTAKFMSFLL